MDSDLEDSLEQAAVREDADADHASSSPDGAAVSPATRARVLAARGKAAEADQVRLNQERRRNLGVPLAPAAAPTSRERGGYAVPPRILQERQEFDYQSAIAPVGPILDAVPQELDEIKARIPLTAEEQVRARKVEAAIGAAKVAWGVIQLGLNAATLGLSSLAAAPITLAIDAASEAARTRALRGGAGDSALSGAREAGSDVAKAGAATVGKDVAVGMGAASLIPFAGPSLTIGKGLQALYNAYKGDLGPTGQRADLGDLNATRLAIDGVVADLRTARSTPSLAAYEAQLEKCIEALLELRGFVVALYETYHTAMVKTRARAGGDDDGQTPSVVVSADIATSSRERSDASTQRPG